MRVRVLLSLSLLLAACSEEPEAQSPPRPVIVQPIESASDARALRYPGRVEAAEGTELAFQADGRITRFLVSDGERVERGQVLAELDDTDYRLQLREAEVALRTLEADVTRRRGLRDEGILAPAAVEQAEAQLASARANRDAAARQVGFTRLRAPYEGVVVRRLAATGVVVPAGEPVVRMQDADIIEVIVDIPERDAARLPFGPELVARGRVLALDDLQPMTLVYREHATAPDAQSRAYRLALRGTPPPGVNVLPGMAVQVAIDDPAPSTLAAGQHRVPASAVLSTPDGQAVVWTVDDDGAAQPVPVRVHAIEGTHARIEGELPPSAQVVVAGARLLQAGQVVEPRTRR
ncbi:efflux RND transporter periplasmic adaptor subunit [Luteimonas terrae]|uniref:RND family efflux transporter MFP subunit n=1 Tax=Luteimonas terrae TaxID=1530191 RepID=A0ABU1XRG8_9GAMM|nr:efflux RND transporter periplasmic adaptor subunit [Luteimonas terrae]MDR7191335.1 RND family efflux transporter MFP subunit [Luteimonas terrae]